MPKECTKCHHPHADHSYASYLVGDDETNDTKTTVRHSYNCHIPDCSCENVVEGTPEAGKVMLRSLGVVVSAG